MSDTGNEAVDAPAKVVPVSPSDVPTVKAKLTSVKKNGKRFELKAAARQKLYGYDTVQGSCSDGIYGYYCLYNRNVEKCKIAKVKLSNMKVVKVSGALKISHGNDMTYNKHMKRLIVANNTGVVNRLSIVKTSTLKVEKTVDVEAPKNLEGATKTQAKNVAKYGIAGIAYDASSKQYVALLRNSHNIIVLDSDFTPVRYIVLNMKNNQVYQGIEVTADRIFVVESDSDGKTGNIVTTYDWDGRAIKRYRLGCSGFEVEGVYKKGKTFYASFYRSFYVKKYRYKTVTEKYRTSSGQTKTRKVRRKVAYYALNRENYIYKVKGL